MMTNAERGALARRAWDLRQEGWSDPDIADALVQPEWLCRSLADWWQANRAPTPDQVARVQAELVELDEWAEEVREAYTARTLSLKDAVTFAIRISQARRALLGLDTGAANRSEVASGVGYVDDSLRELVAKLKAE